MNGRRVTSTTSFAESIQRNVRYISHLRIKIRDLEEEASELSQRLNMLLAELDMNRAENNYLRTFQEEVEQQVQLQDALNLSLQEEIRHLRLLTEDIEPNKVSMNLVESKPTTSQGGHAEDDDKPEPKEPKGK